MRLIAALLDPVNKTQAAACAAAKVPARTLQNWLVNDAEFLAALRSAEDAAIGEPVRQLTAVAPAAIGVVVELMEDREVSPANRLRAAGQVLDHLSRLRELRDVEHRLAALEAELSRPAGARPAREKIPGGNEL